MDTNSNQRAAVAASPLDGARKGDVLYRANVGMDGVVQVLAYTIVRAGGREIHLADNRNPHWSASRSSWESAERSGHRRTQAEAVACAVETAEECLRRSKMQILRYERELDALRIAFSNAEADGSP